MNSGIGENVGRKDEEKASEMRSQKRRETSVRIKHIFVFSQSDISPEYRSGYPSIPNWPEDTSPVINKHKMFHFDNLQLRVLRDEILTWVHLSTATWSIFRKKSGWWYHSSLSYWENLKAREDGLSNSLSTGTPRVPPRGTDRSRFVTY